jgi:WD40 repeat protein
MCEVWGVGGIASACLRDPERGVTKAPALQLTHTHTSHLTHHTSHISQVNKLEITSEKQFIAAAGDSKVALFDVNSNNPQPVITYNGHTGNVTAVGFQKDSKWMYTGVRVVCGGVRGMCVWVCG